MTITPREDSLLNDILAASGQAEPLRRISVSRRGFLMAGAATAGGFLIGFSFPHKTRAMATAATVNVFVVFGAVNSITLITPGAEMGQGVNAGMAQVLAEELPLDWSTVKTVSAPYGPQYGRGASKSQVTGGSSSMRGWFALMLQAGATARELLLAAARQRFPDAPAPLRAEASVVKDANGMILAPYGALAEAAATLTLPGPAPLLSQTRGYQVIGQKLPRPDLKLKVDGSAIYGIDTRLPGMVFAAVRHCPVLGGSVNTIPPAPAGTEVVNLGNAIAVTAANTWKAIQTARNLGVTWNMPTAGALAAVDTASLASQAQALMTNATPLASGGTLAVAETVGDVATGMLEAKKKLTLTYSLPFLAHAYMEPLSCTVRISRDAASNVSACDVWAPTQAPDWVARTVTSVTGLADKTRITVTTTYLGGGLGRKIEQDFITQALKVAMAVNKPVKLTWPREEDFARDWYRPSALSRVQVGLDGSGNITAWSNRVVSPSLTRSHGGVPANGLDNISLAGATRLPYAMGSRLVEYVEQMTGMQIGYWRSVGESISCFVVESAIDECAQIAGIDGYAYRRRLLAANPAALAVLDAAASTVRWEKPAPVGRARGIALSVGFGSLCALVVEMAYDRAGTPRIVGINAAVDCGIAVNPDQVVGQLEGGILHGLQAARWGRVSFDHGICQISNFGDYRMGRIGDTPPIKVTIVNQKSPLGGIGEVGVPPVAPALANAYAALTGIRKRSLPLGI